MSLRVFVQHGSVGTRAEREAFETGLLEAFARQAERCERGSSYDQDVSEAFWVMTFGYARITLAQVGRPLGSTEL